MVAVGFEPTKHYANDLKSFPFDQLGNATDIYIYFLIKK